MSDDGGMSESICDSSHWLDCLTRETVTLSTGWRSSLSGFGVAQLAIQRNFAIEIAIQVDKWFQ